MNVDSKELRHTPLYSSHLRHGGKMVPFGGWELPVQYSSLIEEHRAVRSAVGVFDVSHMGEIFVEGPEAEAALEGLTCNRVASLTDGKAQYSAILNPKGGVVDDIIIYRFSRTRFLVCVNASNTEKDFLWFQKHNNWKATFLNRSSEFGQIAIQGPDAISSLAGKNGLGIEGLEGVSTLQPFHFGEYAWKGTSLLVARTGYTGEDGIEVFVPAKNTEELFEEILGIPGIRPCGLGARDTLRLEAAYPLHGHELGDDISALESGLGWIVKFSKGEFVGREALMAQKERGLARKLIGLFLDGTGIARHLDKVVSEQGEIGIVTSGTKTPTLNRALALALVDTRFTELNTKLYVEVRGRRIEAHVTSLPFYRRVGY
jgi:aminomethyltransferase